MTGWARGREEIGGMLERGELSQITANVELADRLLATASQHSSDERQWKLADAIGQAARAALLKRATGSGTHVARETSSQP